MNSNWIKLNGELLLFGPGGVVRMKVLPKYAESRKGGFNTELFSATKSVCYVKETVDELEEIITPALSKVDHIFVNSSVSHCHICNSALSIDLDCPNACIPF